MSEVGFVFRPGQGKASPPRADCIALLAGRQWGVVSRRQLLASGLGSGAVEHALATGRLRRLHRGVYVVGGGALCLEARWMAAVLACGRSAALSHRDAAALSELLRPPRRKLIDVTTPHGSRTRRPGIDLHRTRHLPASSVTLVRGIATTTVSRTLLDLAEVTPAHHLRRAVDEADRRGRLDRRELERLITRANGRHGLAGLRAILDRSGPPSLTRSHLEERFLSLVDAVGLPPHWSTPRSMAWKSTSRGPTVAWSSRSTATSSTVPGAGSRPTAPATAASRSPGTGSSGSPKRHSSTSPTPWRRISAFCSRSSAPPAGVRCAGSRWCPRRCWSRRTRRSGCWGRRRARA